jgi:copper(I)-binding protein
MSPWFRPVALLATVLIVSPALADPGAIEVDHAWSRAAMAGRTGVAYLTIRDKGAPDRLVSVTSPVAERAELHESYSESGVMKMRPVAGLAVAPGNPVTLKPGGYHIMLVSLKRALIEGEKVPLTLTFEKAGPVSVTAVVQKAGAGAMTDQHGHMDMPMGGNGNMDHMHH